MTLHLNLDQRTMVGVCAAIAALLCFTFVFAVWQWHSDWVVAHQTIVAKPAIANVDETTDMIAALPNEHLFGNAFTKTGEVPITNLQLRVTGIVKVDTEQYGVFSKAYISISGQPSKIYQVGDSLPYGVKVYAISQDAVILENAGHLEKLPLPREQLEFKPKLNLISPHEE